MKPGKIHRIKKIKNEVGDICLGSCPEKVPPKKYSFGLGVTEELPLPRGVTEELAQKFNNKGI